MPVGEIGLPGEVRYVKNGPGGRWWRAARSKGELHAGWNEVPSAVLLGGSAEDARPYVEALFKPDSAGRGAANRDLKALAALIERPSRFVWITFEERRMWWCTVTDEVEVVDGGSTKERGHFWLKCDRPWSDRTIDGERQLILSDLPGSVTTVAGYRATVCEPAASTDILRVIRNEDDPAVRTAREARIAYCEAIEMLVRRLQPRDFELLIELILSRDGWARISAVGGSGADIDVEVENRSANEIAFVQVKSQADQSTLSDSIRRFSEQRDRYSRMIFAVHSPRGGIASPGLPVHVWGPAEIADLVVRTGLGDWLEKRV